MSSTDIFNGIRVLVVGDIMIDSYYFGKVDRISPEAPVPVVAVEKKENRLGGAANVALNLVALGAKPTLCTVIGKDNDGENLIELLNQQHIGIQGVVQSDERITTVKTRVIAQNHQMLRIDSEQTDPISAVDAFELIQRIESLMQDCDVLIFEDYDKGVLTESTIERIVKKARSRNIPVIVDPKKRNFAYYNNVTLFKPNLKELKEGAHLEVDSPDSPQFEQEIRALMKRMQIENMMVTLSERGVMITDGTVIHTIPAHVRKIADVSGAGDTVISVAALCMALKMDLKKVAEWSNLAGGMVCEEVGVIPIQKAQFEAELQRLNLHQ